MRLAAKLSVKTASPAQPGAEVAPLSPAQLIKLHRSDSRELVFAATLAKHQPAFEVFFTSTCRCCLIICVSPLLSLCLCCLWLYPSCFLFSLILPTPPLTASFEVAPLVASSAACSVACRFSAARHPPSSAASASPRLSSTPHP